MKKLSLNIKKIVFSLMGVGLAVGAQSFTSAEEVVGNRIDKIYYQLPSGLYTSNPGAGECTEGDNPCTLHYTDSAPVDENFSYDDRPLGNVDESDPGIYQ